MVLSGDLVAPRTDLPYSGGLPDRVLTSREFRAKWIIVSYGQLCRGEWEARVPNPHRLHDVTNQSLRFRPMLTKVRLTRLPYQRSLIEVRAWLSCATRGCVVVRHRTVPRTYYRNTAARELLVTDVESPAG